MRTGGPDPVKRYYGCLHGNRDLTNSWLPNRQNTWGPKHVGHVQDLDTLPAGLGDTRILRFWLREEAGSIERARRGGAAKAAAERMADVLPIKAFYISIVKHLCPNISKVASGIILLARSVRTEVESFT